MPDEPSQQAPIHTMLDAWAEAEIQRAQAEAVRLGRADLSLQPSDSMLLAVRANRAAHARRTIIAYTVGGIVLVVLLIALLSLSGAADAFAEMIAPNPPTLDRFEPLEP